MASDYVEEFGQHIFERDEADHPAFQGEKSLHEGLDRFTGDVWRLLHRIAADGV